MRVSKQAGSQLDSQDDALQQAPELSLKQKQKQDAIDLALMLYGIYKKRQSDDRIVENNGGDND